MARRNEANVQESTGFAVPSEAREAASQLTPPPMFSALLSVRPCCTSAVTTAKAAHNEHATHNLSQSLRRQTFIGIRTNPPSPLQKFMPIYHSTIIILNCRNRQVGIDFPFFVSSDRFFQTLAGKAPNAFLC